MPKANKYNKSYGLSNPLQDIFPEPIVAQRSPTTNDVGYRIGQTWVDQSSGQIYGLASVSAGSATWSIMGPGSSDVDTLTGDSGGAISPTAGNINILGGDGLTVVGSGSTLTINRDAEGGYPITPYVVGPSGEAGYATVQAAIDAANTAGGGVVYIQPGTYTEDLTLYDGVALFGASESLTTIDGTHTPPNSGTVNIFRLTFSDASAIFSSAAAGTTSFIIEDVTFAVTNGYTFDLVNWTGVIALFDIGPGGIIDGGINNTGGATVLLFSGSIGNGTANSMILSGVTEFNAWDQNCPLDMQTGTVFEAYGSSFFQPVTLSNDSTGDFYNCAIVGGSSAAITMDSSGDINLNACTVDSSNTPAIAGTGSGTLTLNGVDFLQDATLASTLTLAGGNSKAGTFETSNASAGLTISGNDIDADGSDSNISIVVTPKGTGDFVVDLGDIQNTSGDIIATHSSAGADVTLEATNSDNTNGASRAGVELAVGGTSAGDPYANFLISGGQTFTMGIDNSTANDDFVISDSAALGTTNRISIDGSSGVVTAVSGFTSTGTTSILDSVNANTSINTGTSTGTVSIGNASAGAITVDTAAGISLDAATASNLTSSLASSAAAVTVSASAADGGITLDAGATPGVTFTNGTQSHQMLVGSGSPNGSVTASQGSLYVDVGGSTSTTILFVNTDGSTTWVGVGA